jgi:hypothetical protein
VTRHSQAPMPEGLRHLVRAGQPPARSVPCPHCGVAAHKPCQVPSSGRRMPELHPKRVAAWARATACCPHCQVAPATPCHLDGRELPDGQVHARRYLEAEATAA